MVVIEDVEDSVAEVNLVGVVVDLDRRSFRWRGWWRSLMVRELKSRWSNWEEEVDGGVGGS